MCQKLDVSFYGYEPRAFLVREMSVSLLKHTVFIFLCNHQNTVIDLFSQCVLVVFRVDTLYLMNPR